MDLIQRSHSIVLVRSQPQHPIKSKAEHQRLPPTRQPPLAAGVDAEEAPALDLTPRGASRRRRRRRRFHPGVSPPRLAAAVRSGGSDDAARLVSIIALRAPGGTFWLPEDHASKPITALPGYVHDDRQQGICHNPRFPVSKLIEDPTIRTIHRHRPCLCRPCHRSQPDRRAQDSPCL